MYRVVPTNSRSHHNCGLTHALVTDGFDGEEVFVCACRSEREANDLADTLNVLVVDPELYEALAA